MKLTILLPCLNEIETLETCINKSKNSLAELGISGEVLVADNGSTDGSQQLASGLGARVINVSTKGYGAAINAGIEQCHSEFIIMGDADDSYALDNIGPFIDKLEEGYELVMGNRFAGGVAPGAMPWLHYYVGNPALSLLGRLLFKVPIKDFHCGLRAFKRESIVALRLSSPGMEFASEMVVKAALNNLKIAEVPTTLKKDGRSRSPHLRTWRDGWRHLIFLLVASPRWLFLYPGMLLTILGSTSMIMTLNGPLRIGDVHLDLDTYFISLGVLLVGIQTILMAVLARVFSTHHGILPRSTNVSKFESIFTLERGVIFGLLLVLTSIFGFGFLFSKWTGQGFNELNSSQSLRISGLLILGLTAGIQILFASFFASMLQV